MYGCCQTQRCPFAYDGSCLPQGPQNPLRKQLSGEFDAVRSINPLPSGNSSTPVFLPMKNVSAELIKLQAVLSIFNLDDFK